MRRRDLLRIATAGAAAGFVAACGGAGATSSPAQAPGERPDAGEPLVAPSTPESASSTRPSTPAPTPTPEPPPPAGTVETALLPGTPYETAATIRHSGQRGPVLMVLGGVHGNEPGGWMAAEEVAGWAPAAGSLIVVPRCNRLAIPLFARTTDELGDLNRLYPGDDASPLPMARMAASIVALAREQRVTALLDLHESWAFYAERTQNGTAFLGQTVTAGDGPLTPALGQRIVERVNGEIGAGRDLLIFRDRLPAEGQGAAGAQGRSRSSLGIGNAVPGLTPILAEMGQQDQPIPRRVQLQLMVVRAAMDELGI